MTSSMFGPVLQSAFVVDDLDAALDHWTQTMQVGPFYLLEGRQFESATYRGAPTDVRFTAALAYWGDMQIELIAQQCDSPSVYKEFLDEGHAGMLHHLLTAVDDMNAFRKKTVEKDIEILEDHDLGQGRSVVYARTAVSKWPLIEVLEMDSRIQSLFDTVRAGADGWTGEDPVRKFS